MKIYPAGHLLCVGHTLYKHVGISDGRGRVYENSHARKGRGLVRYEAFSSGKKIVDLGLLPGSLPVPEMMARAKALIADSRAYRLLTHNCEHFVREVCGLKITSPQIYKAMLAAISVATVIKAAHPAVKGAALVASAVALLSNTPARTPWPIAFRTRRWDTNC